ncbi:MAG TPA: histone H1 [Gammaproteobacteria bacterium]|nr:histone H1 [Gammaproteobacteria bacterium]
MVNPKRPRDANQLAKSIVDLSIGEAEEEKPDDGKDLAAVALGRKGGLKGGKARAAKKAANARWGKKKDI